VIAASLQTGRSPTPKAIGISFFSWQPQIGFLSSLNCGSDRRSPAQARGKRSAGGYPTFCTCVINSLNTVNWEGQAMNLLQKLVALGAAAFILVLVPTLIATPFDYRWFYYAALAVAAYGVWLLVKSSSDPSSKGDSK
jgi:hypothetical protein